MSVRLQFPRGGAFSVSRQFVVADAALDLTSATLEAFLKYSPDDADADAIAELTIAAVTPAQGTVAMVLTGADTADLPRGVEYFWCARATIAGTVYAPENCQGPVVLTPLDGVLAGLLSQEGITETLTPEEAGAAAVSATVSGVINRPDITSLTGGLVTSLDAITTLASTTYTVGTVVVLSYGLVSQLWKLVAGTDAEAPTATPAIVRPDDYNASTNAVVWKQIG